MTCLVHMVSRRMAARAHVQRAQYMHRVRCLWCVRSAVIMCGCGCGAYLCGGFIVCVGVGCAPTSSSPLFLQFHPGLRDHLQKGRDFAGPASYKYK